MLPYLKAHIMSVLYHENKDTCAIGTLTKVATYAIDLYVTNLISCSAALPPCVPVLTCQPPWQSLEI